LRVVCASGTVASAHAVAVSQASAAAFSMLSAAAAETDSEPVSVLAKEFSSRSVEALLRLIYEGVASADVDDSEEVLSLCKAIGMTGVEKVAPRESDEFEMCHEVSAHAIVTMASETIKPFPFVGLRQGRAGRVKPGRTTKSDFPAFPSFSGLSIAFLFFIVIIVVNFIFFVFLEIVCDIRHTERG
jgi:hypothetical protein